MYIQKRDRLQTGGKEKASIDAIKAAVRGYEIYFTTLQAHLDDCLALRLPVKLCPGHQRQSS